MQSGRGLLEHWLPRQSILKYWLSGQSVLGYQWSLPFRSEAGRPMHALSYILFPLK